MLLVIAAIALTAAVFQTRVLHLPGLRGPSHQIPIQPVQAQDSARPAESSPAEVNAQELSSPQAPADRSYPQPRAVEERVVRPDRELALTLVPGLLEMGVPVMAMGPDDDGRSVLVAVNGLRRQEGLPLYERIDQNVADYVDIKVDQYREHLASLLRVQIALDSLGFDPGPIDGVLGPRTLDAIRRYQEAARMPVTGELTDEQIDALETLSFDKGVSRR